MKAVPPRRPTTRLSEKHVQRQIVDYLQLIGAQVYVLGTKRRKGDHQGTMQTPGIPDLWVFLPPAKVLCSEERAGLWIEVKADDGRCSPAQLTFQKHAHESRVNYVCGNLDAVQTWLANRGWIRPLKPPPTKDQNGSTLLICT